MKRFAHFFLTGIAAALLVLAGAGCTAKVKSAYHQHRADKYYAAGQFDRAEIEYMNVLRNDGQNAEAFERLAGMFFQQGRFQTAAPYLIRATSLATNNLELRLDLGKVYAAAGDMKDARAEANFILDRNPQNEEAPLLLVQNASTPPEIAAVRTRLQALARSGDRASFQVALGTLAFNEKDLKTAEADFKRALTLDPKSVVALGAMGAFYAAQNDFKDADADLKAASDASPARSTQRMLYARFKLEMGDAGAARQILEDVIKQAPDYLPALMGLAEIALDAKKFDESRDYLKKVLSLDPDNFDGLMFDTRLNFAQGENGKALTGLERMSKIYPQSPQVNFQLAAAYLANGEDNKAITSVTRALDLYPNFADAIQLLAQIQIQNHNPDPAIAALEQLTKKQPQLIRAQLLLADAYRQHGQIDNSLAIYQSLEKAFPTNLTMPLLIGAAYLQQNDYAQARTSFERALALEPGNLQALGQLVDTDLADKKFDAAMQLIQDRLNKDPKSDALQLLVAKVFLAQGSRDKAEATLSKAIELDPQNEDAYLLLAQLYVDAKELPKALAELDAVLSKNPKNISALMLAAIIYNNNLDYKNAAATYEKLLQVNPNFTPAINNLAYIYSEFLGKPDRAFELAKHARELLPFDPNVADTLGWISLNRGSYPTALGLLQESAAKLPDVPEVQFHLGLANYMTDNEAAARAAFQRALQPGTDFPGRDECQLCFSLLNINPQTADAADLAKLEKRVAQKTDDPVAHARLAAIYQRDGKADQAIANYEAVLQADPKNPAAMISLAQLYAPKDVTKAYDKAKSAYMLAPDNAEAAHIYGRMAYQNGDFKLAATMLQQAAKNQPGDPASLFDYAQAAYSIGNVPAAQTAMQSALQANLPESQANAARRFLDMIALADDPAKAVSASARVSEILKAEPDYAPALMALAVGKEQAGDADGAAAACEKILARYQDFAPAQRKLAILYSKNPAKSQAAYAFAMKARDNFPNDPVLAKATAIIVFQQGDFLRAANLLKECAASSPADAEIFYYLGTAQFKLKDRTASKASLQQAMYLKLSGSQADAAKQMLAQLK
jgi:tetratricopeptide (TPR) repeat protein